MMTVHKGKGGLLLILLAAASLAIGVPAGNARAATGDEICAGIAANPPTYDPNGDFDLDGFSNKEECDGYFPVLRIQSDNTCRQPQPSLGYVKEAGSGVVIAGYTNRGNSERTKYLDPSSRDVFFTWTPGTGTPAKPFSLSDLGTNPFSYYNAGLSITTHQITLDNTCGVNPATRADTRWVTYHIPAYADNNAGQKAVKVKEDFTVGSAAGISSQGTPLDNGVSTIYTQKIWNIVSTSCDIPATKRWKTLAVCHTSVTPACTGTCYTTAKKDAAKNTVFLEYVRYVLSHELSHVGNLAQPWNCTDDYHYPGGSMTLMEKVPSVTTTNDIVFNLSGQYNSKDSGLSKLRGKADYLICP